MPTEVENLSYQYITAYLHGLADAEIASHSQRFFKTAPGDYGHGDKFLGIRVPVLRQAVKQFSNTSLTVTTKLLRSDQHEIRLFALFLLVAKFSSADARADASADENTRKKIFELYLENTLYINNWDLVDSSAHKIIGAYLEDRDRAVLYQLAESTSLWERRIAIIATFHFIRIEQFDDTLNISEQLLHDQEDLIHKAVGWMLREVGKRDRVLEERFLKRHYLSMPRTMLRYAIEKFNPQERQLYLNGDA